MDSCRPNLLVLCFPVPLFKVFDILEAVQGSLEQHAPLRSEQWSCNLWHLPGFQETISWSDGPLMLTSNPIKSSFQCSSQRGGWDPDSKVISTHHISGFEATASHFKPKAAQVKYDLVRAYKAHLDSVAADRQLEEFFQDSWWSWCVFNYVDAWCSWTSKIQVQVTWSIQSWCSYHKLIDDAFTSRSSRPIFRWDA